MPGKLRQALEDMTRENLDAHGITGWLQLTGQRFRESNQLFRQFIEEHPIQALFSVVPIAASLFLYSLTGSETFKPGLGPGIKNGGVPDISKTMADLLAGIEKDPLLREIAESYGAIYNAPFDTFFQLYAGREDMDIEEFDRAMDGVNATINLQAGILGAAYELLGLGQTDAFNQMAASMQEAIPARQLTSRLKVPMIDAGIGGRVTRYWNEKYRPTRFKASDLRDLYALGEIDQEAVRKGAAGEGWRDEDIEKWIRLAFRKLAQGDIFTAFHKDLISEAEAVTRLRALGYDPEDIPLLFQLNPDPDSAQDKQATAADARAAFRDSVIGEDQLRTLLKALNYSDAAIDLILAIERSKIDNSSKSLSIGEIRAAWIDNILTDQEALYYLAQADVTTDRAGILLETWKRQTAPTFRKLNAGTILEAYVDGVTSRAQALGKLTSIGFSSDDADLQVRLAELRNPDVFQGISPAKSRRVGPGQLSQLVSLGLITPAQMSVRLQAAGYPAEDANLLSEAARLKSEPAARTLPQSVIDQAYLAGLIERAQAVQLYGSIGFSPDQADLILATLESRNQATLTAAPLARVRTLTQSQIEQLYLGGILDETIYRARLGDLGFVAGDIDLIVARDNQLLTPVPRALTQGAIEQAYLAGVYDRTTAYNRLVAADFTPEDANTLLNTVEAKNPSAFSPGLVQSSRVPSITTLANALQNGVIDQVEYTARAQEVGYSAQDAALYTALAVSAERKASKTLSLSQVLAAYNKGLMSRGASLSRITGMGYSNDDANLILRIEKESVQLSDTWDSLLSGALGPFDAVAALASANYSDQDILAAFQALDASTLANLGIDLDQLAATLAAIPGGE